MNLLIAVIALTFVSACRQDGSSRMMRPVPLLGVCFLIAVAYMSQKVI